MGPACRRPCSGSAGGRSRTAPRDAGSRCVPIECAGSGGPVPSGSCTVSALVEPSPDASIPPRTLERDARLPREGQPNRRESAIGWNRPRRPTARIAADTATPPAQCQSTGNALVAPGDRTARETVERREVQPRMSVLPLKERAAIRRHLAAHPDVRQHLQSVPIRENRWPHSCRLRRDAGRRTPMASTFCPRLQDTRAPRASPRRSEYRSPPSPRHLPSGAKIETCPLLDWNPDRRRP